ncbi:MAG TPA: ABC transporter permease [Dictyoglomaceae bacterium]|nr:ABC transporter permease [Dictyoglomaceae bacterium]HOL38755.1 ABC transporter permease [Dictyoglomaceae bacterium]HOP94541.1 ABC transporter permease [Dictyoglomaceae bacterium]HPP15496.1 ABC transporter permease [Dictyoglomaceae bacterium]HPU43095.1 ABC transporter permease [Dictyoglomaceae bacterium]
MENIELTSTYSLKGIIKEIFKYKTAKFSLLIFILLIAISIFAYTTMPYDEAKKMWNDSQAWLKNPRNAIPVWWGVFTGKKLPQNIDLKNPEIKVLSESPEVINYSYNFTFNYDDFPTEFNIFLKSAFKEQPPIIKIYWEKPNGDKIFLTEKQVRSENDTFYIGNEFTIEDKLTDYLTSKLGYYPSYPLTVMRGLFVDTSGNLNIEKGNYKLHLEVNKFNKEDTIEIEPIIYGKVYGIAGTDHLRRPLELGILWGTPVDLAFGLGASIIITFLYLILATISGWYGGKIDNIIQRLTEIYMLLPFLPLMIMISLFYKLNIWKLLIVLILLSLFGPGIKTQRAMVLQVKTLPYIEAAKTYGASNMRIVFLYIIPKILPPVIPGLIISIPSYVFLESTLSLFGVLDPTEPTLGRIIQDAFQNGALYKGFYYWVIEPSLVIVLMAISFALLGFVLDRIVNPKLKEI